MVMTKKLEELFNLPTDATPEEATSAIAQSREILHDVDLAIDKIDVALPMVRDLDTADSELDELASLAKEKAEDLFLNICRENIWSFDTYSQTDIDNILADGWEKWGDNSVSIVWPDVK